MMKNPFGYYATYVVRAFTAAVTMFIALVKRVYKISLETRKAAIGKLKSVDMPLPPQSFYFKRIAAVFMFLLIVSLNANAQDSGMDFSTPDSLFGGLEALYGALVIVGGYVSSFIPGLKDIDNGIYRVLAWAILTGVGFFLFGAPILSLAITYAISTSLYEVILKLFKKTDKPADLLK